MAASIPGEAHRGARSAAAVVVRVLALAVLGGAAWLVWGDLPTQPEGVIAVAVASYLLAWLAAFALVPDRAWWIVTRFVLVTVAVVGTFAVLEAVGWIGWVDYGRLRPEPPVLWERAENRFHPEMRYTREPHVRLTGQSPGNIANRWCILDRPSYRYDVRYDRWGFRNPTDLETADVVVLGDSFVEGAILPDADVVTSRLAERTGLAVANLAIAGYGPGEELAALETIGRSLGPRAVVWAFYEGNDPENVWRYDFWVDEGRPAPPAPQPVSLVRALAERAAARSCTVTHWLAGRHAATLPRPDGGAATVYFNGPPRTDVSDATLAVIQATLTRGHETARELGARMLILFVPRKFRVYHSLVEVPEKSWLLRWPVGDFPERFGRMVAEISPDIRYVDLTPVLSREVRAGRPTYLEDDSHWSAAGHAAVADVIAEWLAAEPPTAGTGSP